MQIKDLAETDFVGRHVQVCRGFSLIDAFLLSDLPQIFSQSRPFGTLLPIPKFRDSGLRLVLFSSFSYPKKCIIMHFSPKSAPNMHYNALFNLSIPAASPNSRPTKLALYFK